MEISTYDLYTANSAMEDALRPTNCTVSYYPVQEATVGIYCDISIYFQLCVENIQFEWLFLWNG